LREERVDLERIAGPGVRPRRVIAYLRGSLAASGNAKRDRDVQER
jgi:hypothetical protein